MDGAERFAKTKQIGHVREGVSGRDAHGEVPVCPLEAIELTEPLLIDTDECCE